MSEAGGGVSVMHQNDLSQSAERQIGVQALIEFAEAGVVSAQTLPPEATHLLQERGIYTVDAPVYQEYYEPFGAFRARLAREAAMRRFGDIALAGLRSIGDFATLDDEQIGRQLGILFRQVSAVRAENVHIANNVVTTDKVIFTLPNEKSARRLSAVMAVLLHTSEAPFSLSQTFARPSRYTADAAPIHTVEVTNVDEYQCRDLSRTIEQLRGHSSKTIEALSANGRTLRSLEAMGVTFPPEAQTELHADDAAYRHMIIGATYRGRPGMWHNRYSSLPAGEVAPLAALRDIFRPLIRANIGHGTASLRRHPDKTRRLFDPNIELAQDKSTGTGGAGPPRSRTLTSTEMLTLHGRELGREAAHHPLRTGLEFVRMFLGGMPDAVLTIIGSMPTLFGMGKRFQKDFVSYIRAQRVVGDKQRLLTSTAYEIYRDSVLDARAGQRQPFAKGQFLPLTTARHR